MTAITLVLPLSTGCATRRSHFQITDFREPGVARPYGETFDEAYYRLDDSGNLSAILRRLPDRRADPSAAITQVIHIRSFWRPIPGRTVADRTQINATVTYYILVGQTGATFEGTGAVFFQENRSAGTLKGSVDLAILHPRRELTVGSDLFTRAELAGSIHAIRDPRQVTDIVNELDRQFGPGH